MSSHLEQQSALSRAWDDTKTSMHKPYFFWLVGVIAAGLGVFIGMIITPERASSTISAVYQVFGGIIGIIIGFILIFIENLLLAPYRQRNEANIRINELESKERQKANLIIKEAREENYHTVGQSWGLVIENLGTEDAKMCEAQLLEIEFTNPPEGLSMERWPVNRRLLIEGGGTIKGKSTKLLHVSYLVPSSMNNMKLQLAYAESEDFRQEHAFSGGIKDVLLVISIASQSTPPIYSVTRLIKRPIGWGYDLILLANNITTRPSVKDYRQPS